MVPVVAQEIIYFIVILGECRLPGPVLPEGEHILLGGALLEAVGVNVNAILAVFRPACEDQVAGLQNPELPDVNHAVFIDRHTVHPALLGHDPLTFHLKILREDAHGMVMLRRYAVLGAGDQDRIGGILKFLLGEVRGSEGTQGKAHDNRSFTCLMCGLEMHIFPVFYHMCGSL